MIRFRSTKVKGQPSSPYLSEFRNRPAMERRATSIHLHVTGQSGPASKDVANAAMRALSSLFGHSNGGQAAITMQAAIDCFNDRSAWGQPDHCRWLAVHAAEWTQYQHRYAIPSRLVECLVQDQDSTKSASRQNTLAAMITTVFTSPTPLVNLSTSDIISSLVSVVLRRISKDPDDPLLPALVKSISSLGTHVYYADQIQDLAGELISRLVAVESNGVLVGSKLDNDKGRVQAIRCLLAALLGLIHSAEVHDTAKDDPGDAKTPQLAGQSSAFLRSPILGNADGDAKTARPDGQTKPARRTNVPADVWQDTLSLLCEGDYGVRADYAATLVAYLEREVQKLWDCTDTDGVKRIRPLAEGPIQQANVNWTVLHGDNTTRFLNSLHAYIYVLATSSNLVISPHSSTPSPHRSVNGETATSTVVSDDTNVQDLTEEAPQRRRSLAIPRTRKISVLQRLLRSVPSRLSTVSATSSSATLSDYGNMAAVLRTVFTYLPVRGLLTGVPMLLALNTIIQNDGAGATSRRAHAIRDVLASCWLVIGKVWDCAEVCQIAEKVRQRHEIVCLLP